jgi:hypothetical protein
VGMKTLKIRKQSWELSARTLLVCQDWFHKFKQCSVVWVWVYCDNKFFCSLKLWLAHSLCSGSQKASWLRFKQSQCGQQNVSPRYKQKWYPLHSKYILLCNIRYIFMIYKF